MSKETLPQDLSRVREVESFDILLKNVIQVLEEAKEQSPHRRLGYVSGIITSDGPEFLELNRKTLQIKTEKFRDRNDFPVFCANDIFTPELVDRLGHKESNYIFFWRKLFEADLITDVIMTTGWERSRGAKDEHLMAELLDLNIQYEEHEVKYLPTEEDTPHNRLKRLFVNYEMETVDTDHGRIWWKTEVDLEGGECVSLGNISPDQVSVRVERHDLIFLFALNEKGLSYIDGVYLEVGEEGAQSVYLKEFFEGGELELLDELIQFVEETLEKKKIMPLPASLKQHKKDKTHTRLRL